MSGINASIAVWQLLNTTAVTSLLDGGLYRYNRPINSRKRDIVISTPEPDKVDINIHAPNLTLQDDQTSPDLARMKSVTDAVLLLLAGFEFDRIGLPERDKDGQWFTNIRINYAGAVDAGVSASLITLSRQSDGYGGFTATRSTAWTGLARRLSTRQGSQVVQYAGRTEMIADTDWMLPLSAAPEKYMLLTTAEGEYVIQGIAPEAGNWRLNTRRKDGYFGTVTT